jgi:phospholipid/cholesterol/gamma-HCH transport system permease protein
MASTPPVRLCRKRLANNPKRIPVSDKNYCAYYLVFRPLLFLTNCIVDPTELLSSFISIVGDFFLFVWETLKAGRGLWLRFGLVLKQCEFVGVGSLGMITVAAIFLGAVLGYQLYISFHMFGADALLGGSVGVALFRELAPVMGAIMVLGRAGAAMAAEIASMRVSEQIDALEVMAVDPMEYLVVPRVVAGILTVPLLSVYFGMVGSIAAAGVACGIMGLDSSVYWHEFSWVVDPIELIHCVTKGAAFGLVLTWIACFCGFRAYGGARSVGLATRSTVVASLLVILFSDYLLTSLLPYGFATLKVRGL